MKKNSGRPAPPIISFVGKSNSGKTTFLEKLIPELRRRGFRVGVIKHDTHGFDIDHPGKDSYRLKAAGANSAIISSPAKLALVKDTGEDLPLDTLRDDFLMDMDIVLTEGYKRERAPKIEVSLRENTTEILCGEGECIAIVADWKPETGAPLFDLNNASGVADFIQEKFLK